ncbi:MAG TPA: PEP-CTERM sorting domain-containing protein [Methylomirabilota bacterium]
MVSEDASVKEVRVRKGLAVVVAGLLAYSAWIAPAEASLIFDQAIGVTGSGIGAVATVLTFQSPGSTSLESGSVTRSGGTDVTSDQGVLAPNTPVTFGDVKTGSSQTQTQPLSAVGITSNVGPQIAIIFNAAEPAGNSVTVTGLRLSIFNGNTDIFDASLQAAVNFAATFTGIGKEGFVFRLDTTEANQLNSTIAALGLSAAQIGALRVALSGSAAEATGGPETFNLGSITAGAVPAAVPEPGTLLLFGSALGAFGFWSRRRRGGAAVS